MAYSAEISRLQPTCFVFLIDQTGSMGAPFGSHREAKAVALADAVNRLLQNLIIRSTKEEGVRDYFHCALFGFGRTDGALGPAWAGALGGRTLVPVSEIAENPLRIEERSIRIADGGEALPSRAIKMPIWVEPIAELGQPAPGHANLIERACDLACSVIQEWVQRYPNGYPPTVVLITDGGEEGGDPVGAASRLKSVATRDGTAALFCCHVSHGAVAPILYPANEEGLPDNYARMLFRMCSTLPAPLLRGLQSDGLRVNDSARGFVFNADVVALIRFLDIGTRISQMAEIRPGR